MKIQKIYKKGETSRKREGNGYGVVRLGVRVENGNNNSQRYDSNRMNNGNHRTRKRQEEVHRRRIHNGHWGSKKVHHHRDSFHSHRYGTSNGGVSHAGSSTTKGVPSRTGSSTANGGVPSRAGSSTTNGGVNHKAGPSRDRSKENGERNNPSRSPSNHSNSKHRQ